MSERIILMENRVEEFNRIFGRKFPKEQKERIINEIPSKYWNWVGKALDQLSFEKYFEKTKNLLNYFNKFGSNLVKTDIQNYEGVYDLEKTLDEYANRQRRNFKKLHGANIVFDSPKYLVVNPLSPESSCYYGKGTKWCTASLNSDATFNKFNTDGKLFYILNKTLPSSDPLYKIGLSKKFDGDESFYDAQDIALTNIPSDLSEIMEKINLYLNTEYKEQIDAVSEEKRKQAEEKTRRSLELQRIRRAKEAEMDERRTEQEWAMNADLSDEGKMAWAVLDYLETNGADLRNKEEENKLIEIESQLIDLNNQYDQAPGPATDILDRISELEDEKDEILSKLDVYYIIPTSYDHYGLNKFEVIHPDNYEETYAVGTQDEVDDAMREYVENLIDDIGVTSFRDGFWQQFLDEDQITDHIMDHLENDIYENPDSYFSDDERMLSTKQMDEIRFKKLKVEKLEKTIETIEEMSFDEENEEAISEYEAKIKEIEEEIEELEDEITEIEEDPDGDYPDELFQDKIDDWRRDIERDPTRHMEDWGLNAEDYVDKEKLIDGVIDEDGYMGLSPYDGSYEEVQILGETYFVFRID